MKVCGMCNKKKNGSEFNKNKTLKDGLAAYCKDCMKKRYYAPKPVKKAYVLNGVEVYECNKCGKVKPLSEYCKSKTSSDGHGHRCKNCMSRYTYAIFKKRKESLSYEVFENKGKEYKRCKVCLKVKSMNKYKRHKNGKYTSACMDCLSLKNRILFEWKSKLDFEEFKEKGVYVKRCKYCLRIKPVNEYKVFINGKKSLLCGECLEKIKRGRKNEKVQQV